ncbi:MAG: hypothetical protein KY450_03970, partial [Actinobacteria bacterium]|nr:hypothetical protein [Actinomycetota bacterium]
RRERCPATSPPLRRPTTHAAGAKSPTLSPTGASLGNQIGRRRQWETLWCFGYYRRPCAGVGPVPMVAVLIEE